MYWFYLTGGGPRKPLAIKYEIILDAVEKEVKEGLLPQTTECLIPSSQVSCIMGHSNRRQNQHLNFDVEKVRIFWRRFDVDVSAILIETLKSVKKSMSKFWQIDSARTAQLGKCLRYKHFRINASCFHTF